MSFDENSRVSQIVKQQIELMNSLMKLSIYVSPFDKGNELLQISNNLPKLPAEDLLLTNREPPTIAPPKIKPSNIQNSPAQDRVNIINRLEKLTLLFRCDEIVIYPKKITAINDTQIEIVGFK